MVNSIGNSIGFAGGWQKINFDTNTSAATTSPNIQYNNSSETPSAAMTFEEAYYGEKPKKHTFRKLLVTLGVIGGGTYVGARWGVPKMKNAPEWLKNSSKKYVELFSTAGNKIKTLFKKSDETGKDAVKDTSKTKKSKKA